MRIFIAVSLLATDTRTHSQLSARLWEVSGGGEEGDVGGVELGCQKALGCGWGRLRSGATVAIAPTPREERAPAIFRDLLATQRGLP